MTQKKALSLTDKDFDSIRQACLFYAKKYYPDSYKNLSSTSFGSMIFDIFSDIGDNLSYYIDYNTNESLLENAVEFRNIEKISKQMGLKFTGSHATYSTIDIFVLIPASANRLPNNGLLPIIRKGSTVSSDGASVFTINEDIDFTNGEISFAVSDVDSNGYPTSFAVKKSGQIVSGESVQKKYDIGSIEGFVKIPILDSNFIHVESVFDSSGNEYHQVDSLSQSIIQQKVPNSNINSSSDPKFFLKNQYVSRKFIVDKSGDIYFIIFGNGKEDTISDSSELLLDLYGREQNKSSYFDPLKLVTNNTMGISPANTTVTVSYRTSGGNNSNVSIGSINKVNNVLIDFDSSVTELQRRAVTSSVEVTNPEQISGSRDIKFSEEMKYLAYGSYGSQNRAVTRSDYEFICYNMNPEFGSVKRASALIDNSSFNKMINIYVISEDLSTSNLMLTSKSIKNNLKNHIMKYNMMNDTINIVDSKVVNLKIEFNALVVQNKSKFDILQECYMELKKLYVIKHQIGEPLIISDIYKVLNDLPNVIDITNVIIKSVVGSNYNYNSFDIDENLTSDENILMCPEDTIFEIKYLDKDIKGIIIQ